MDLMAERFYARNVREKVGDCWNTFTELQAAGHEGVKGTARRHSYKLMYGDISQGQRIHNTCNNRKCINPKHLELLVSERQKKRELSQKIPYPSQYQ